LSGQLASFSFITFQREKSNKRDFKELKVTVKVHQLTLKVYGATSLIKKLFAHHSAGKDKLTANS